MHTHADAERQPHPEGKLGIALWPHHYDMIVSVIKHNCLDIYFDKRNFVEEYGTTLQNNVIL